MKRRIATISALSVLLLCGVVWAHGVATVVVGQGVSGAASPCPSGTYLFVWNGDYTSDSDEGCFASGASHKTGTASGGTIGATGQTGNGYRKTANNQYVTWDISSDDGGNEDLGTIWASVYITDDGTDSVIDIAGLYAATTDLLRMYVSNTRVAVINYKHNNTNDSKTTTATVTEGEWVRIGVTWDLANDLICAQVASGGWDCNTNPDITDWGNEPIYVYIGEYAGGSESDTCDIDNVYVLGTYQAADPL